MQVLIKYFTPLGLPDIEDEDEDMDGKFRSFNFLAQLP
jgi:hypothetical protein